ncbi:unnamed protein product [Oppiella nova]|uniref:Suppressor of white apricot N-terminal domain-containing protein n=1 Tax=Oppiella nova TaxID=334625 RepID=A0A7R9QV72_9ACAR|nr:unnamed protein product [Oppiella nova]CAG2176775.1 unnamed protein product [Oppiella nova]
MAQLVNQIEAKPLIPPNPRTQSLSIDLIIHAITTRHTSTPLITGIGAKGMDTTMGSYSLFRSIGSEPTHLWSQTQTQRKAGHHHHDRAHTSASGGHGSSGGAAPADDSLDQLFVFGYSCKLFRDDLRAQEMDSGQHLIGWNGSTDHLIDRSVIYLVSHRLPIH